MSPVRLLLALLLIAVAIAPIAAHFAVLGQLLAASGHRRMAVLSLVGSVTWLAICWNCWRPAKGRQP